MGRAQLMWATSINAYLPARRKSLSSDGTPTQAACTDPGHLLHADGYDAATV